MAYFIFAIIIIGISVITLLKTEKEIPYRFHNDEIDIDNVEFSTNVRNLVIDENNLKKGTK